MFSLYDVIIRVKSFFHHAATFEFASNAYNLLAIINQHTKVINEVGFTFFDKRGNITKTNCHICSTLFLLVGFKTCYKHIKSS